MKPSLNRGKLSVNEEEFGAGVLCAGPPGARVLASRNHVCEVRTLANRPPFDVFPCFRVLVGPIQGLSGGCLLTGLDECEPHGPGQNIRCYRRGRGTRGL